MSGSNLQWQLGRLLVIRLAAFRHAVEGVRALIPVAGGAEEAPASKKKRTGAKDEERAALPSDAVAKLEAATALLDLFKTIGIPTDWVDVLKESLSEKAKEEADALWKHAAATADFMRTIFAKVCADPTELSFDCPKVLEIRIANFADQRSCSGLMTHGHEQLMPLHGRRCVIG